MYTSGHIKHCNIPLKIPGIKQKTVQKIAQ